MKWGAAELHDLHPDFRAAVIPILDDAEADGLDVRRQSGYRSNARQSGLHTTYLIEKAKFDRGERKEEPLPAAPAGKSAHNFALCSRDTSHLIGNADKCPSCGAATIGASLALDVAILDPDGRAVHCPPERDIAKRPEVWQRWSVIL